MAPIPSLFPPRTEAAARRLVPVVLLLYAMQLAWWSLGADVARLLALVPDDVSYYLQIAANALDGRGFSFDGLHPTDGFQPLWQWLLVLVIAPVRHDPEAALRLALLAQCLLLGAASLTLFRALGRRLPGSLLLPGAVVYGYLVVAQGVDGMETALASALVAVLAATALGGRVFDGGDARAQGAWGGLLGLAMLARLDAVFLGAAVCAFVLAQAPADPARRREHLRRLLWILLGATLVVAPYLVGNVLLHGSPSPISVRLKSSFPQLAPDGLAKIPRAHQAVVVLALSWLAVAAAARRRLSELESAVAVLAGFVVLHALNALLFLKWAVHVWHFAAYWTFAALALLALGARLAAALPLGLRRAFPYWIVMALLLTAAGWRLHLRQGRSTENWHSAARAAALWARDNTPPQTIFAMKDAGHFAWFSGRRTVNLDGVVNDAAFQDALRDRRLGAYLRECGAAYLVQHAIFDDDAVVRGDYGAYRMRYRSHLHEAWSETLTLPAAAEAYRSRPYPAHGVETVLVVWRLPGGGG